MTRGEHGWLFPQMRDVHPGWWSIWYPEKHAVHDIAGMKGQATTAARYAIDALRLRCGAPVFPEPDALRRLCLASRTRRRQWSQRLGCAVGAHLIRSQIAGPVVAELRRQLGQDEYRAALGHDVRAVTDSNLQAPFDAALHGGQLVPWLHSLGAATLIARWPGAPAFFVRRLRIDMDPAPWRARPRRLCVDDDALDALIVTTEPDQ